MAKSKFDKNQRYKYAIYARMSTKHLQNEKSPEQQIDNIRRELRLAGLEWEEVAIFLDRGKSGRRQRHRPEYLKMLRQIRTRVLTVDLILVDTIERFGRYDGMSETIRKLRNEGVFLLTADDKFADPTEELGDIKEALRVWRASSEFQVKKKNVLRGKRYALHQKRWPGGPPPFGYKLKTYMKVDGDRELFDYSELVIDLETSWIIKRVFALAEDRGWGSHRIAKELNQDEAFLKCYSSKIIASTIDYWLRSQIYTGNYLWEKNTTEIARDSRIIVPNEKEEMTLVKDFCDPIISKETWGNVQMLRKERSEKFKTNRQLKSSNSLKLLKARNPGITLKYPLTGLLYCDCGLRMSVSSTGNYTSINGENRSYPGYTCRANHSGACENRIRVPEDWLRSQVFDSVRGKLFPQCDECDDQLFSQNQCVPDWLCELTSKVQNRIEQLATVGVEAIPALKNEFDRLESLKRGWLMSLGDPTIPLSLRENLRKYFDNGSRDQQEISRQIDDINRAESSKSKLVQPVQVYQNLMQLDQVLGSENASRVNSELSRYIDRISCDRSGNVVLRLCKLGFAPDAIDTIISLEPESVDQNGTLTKPSRRRSRVRIDDGIDEEQDEILSELASNPDRFVGLSDEWFWEIKLQIPESKTWAEKNSEAVFQRRLDGQLSFTQLADEFGVSRPTIAAAVKQHLELHPDAVDLKLRSGGKRGPKVDLDVFADEALSLFNQGWSKLRLAERFGYSTPVITKALLHAASKSDVLVASKKAAAETQIAKCREFLDQKMPINEISKQLEISTTTVRKYLKKSYASEGAVMPDQRRK